MCSYIILVEEKRNIVTSFVYMTWLGLNGHSDDAASKKTTLVHPQPGAT